MRYRNTEIDPARFLNRGWRGLLVRIYARIISWLERKTAWHVMHLFAEDKTATPAEVRQLEEAFTQEGVDAVQVVRDLLHPPESNEPETRADRYKDSSRVERGNTSFAAILAPGRQKRYARGRMSRLAYREGDLHEAVPAANFKGDHDGQET